MCHRIFVSNSVNPYENLAVEEYLCRKCTNGATLFLWQNYDTVVIGKNQNSLRECNLSALRRDGVLLARRSTGGGAVYHDAGNLNFSLIFPSAKLDKEPGYALVQLALEKLGISCSRSGRNDLRVEDGKKVSGNAFRHKDGVTLHHGTLLVSSCIEKMSDYLRPSFEKLRSHGVESVPARVANLSDIKPMDVDDVKAALIEAFREIYGSSRVEKFRGIEELDNYASFLASSDWLYGRDTASDISLSKRFTWGSLELEISLQHATVRSVRVYTDAMDPSLAEMLEMVLCGIKAEPGALSAAVRNSEAEERESIAAWLEELSF